MGNLFLRAVQRRKMLSSPIYPALAAALSLVFAMTAVMVTISPVQAGSIVRIAEGDEWVYFTGKQGPPPGWNRSGFNSAGWQKGLSGFGYGKGNNRTWLGDMQGHYLTVYAGREFILEKTGLVTLKLSAACDGLFVAYLNGIEVIRGNALQASEQLDISGFAYELVLGKNILSVECSNDDISSGDFSFIPVFEIMEKGGAQ